MPDVNGLKILDINADGRIISVTQDTLDQIKGMRLEALFSGRWDKRLQRDDEGRVFLDVNPKCFRVVVDYLNECRIAPTDCSPKILHLWGEDDTFLQKLLLTFGLRDDVIDQSKRLIRKLKLGQAYNYSDENFKASDYKWKLIKFDHFSKGTSHNIYTVLKEERKALLAANNDLVQKRILFEEENKDLRFLLGYDEDMVFLNVSGTIMATNRSTLGLCKDSALVKQFDNPLWTQKYKTTPAKQWIC